jgi:uncharacterized protein (TIGR02996 family)
VNTRNDLFRAVCEHPDEDAPRLVFADWLEEHGEAERAEFIRVHVATDRMPKDDPNYTRLMQRRGELFARNNRDWHAGLPKLPGVEWALSFPRGFVGEVTFADVKAFRRHADAVFAGTPVEDIHFKRLHPREAGIVAASPYLARLIALELGPVAGGRGIGPAGAAAVANSPHLAKLEYLNLDGHLIGTAGVEALAASEHLPNLRQIVLTRNGLDANAVGLLFGSPRLARLRCVNLSDNPIGDAGARLLAESPPHPDLTDLSLDSTGIRDDGARALAASPGLARVVWLDLSRNEITAAGASALVGSLYLGKLERLELTGNRIDASRALELRRRFRGKELLLGGQPAGGELPRV